MMEMRMCRPTCRAGAAAARAALVTVGLLIGLAPLCAADEPPIPPPPTPPTWSLSGHGDGVSKLIQVERGGRKLQVLYANGGNTLVVTRLAKSPAEAEGPRHSDMLKLRCDLLLAEYDDQTRQIERLLCAGRVQVTIRSQRTDAPDDAGQESYFDAAALTFQRSAQGADPQPPATQVGALGLMNGSWTLSPSRPAWPDLPAEFAAWLENIPAASGERVLLRADRLTVLAPEVIFDPVAGQCSAGPDRVTGSFEPAPIPVAGSFPVDPKAGRSAAWSDRRRTVFSCQTLRGHFILDGKGLELSGPTVMQGRVCVYQPAANGLSGRAELRGETITMQWPAKPDRDAAGASTWQGYQSLTVEGGGDRPEIELRDGDLLIRGGTLRYSPGEDSGQLTPASGQKYAVSEMNLAADPAHPASLTPGRVRLAAEQLNFHLKTRNFEAVGERVLENLPAAAPPAPSPK